MAQISTEDKRSIDLHPLAPILEPLRPALRSVGKEEETSLDGTTDTPSSRAAISSILLALLTHPVATLVQASGRLLSIHIASLYLRLQSDAFDTSLFQPLRAAVLKPASDLELWSTVLQLIDAYSRITPPPPGTVPNTFQGTPWTCSSASHQGSDQKRRELELRLRRELATCTFENVPGFVEKFFGGTSWSDEAAKICDALRKANDGDMLREYPKVHEEEAIWKWLTHLQTTYLTESPNVYDRTTSKGKTATDAERQLDLVVQARGKLPTGKLDMKQVSVVGELTSSAKSQRWLAKYIQLATYIRDVFTAQPTRLYVHGFLLFDSQMQLWVFDRSGAYSSDTFDIFQQAERFIKVIIGYTMMNEEELGCNTFIQASGDDLTVNIEDSTTGEDRVIMLMREPFVKRPSIVSRGTTCYLSKDKKEVIKISWQSSERKPEAEHLTAAKGLRGVAQLKGSRVTTSVKRLREGLVFSRNLLRKIPAEDDLQIAPTLLSFTSQSTKSLGNLSLSGSKKASSDGDDHHHERSRQTTQGGVGDRLGMSAPRPLFQDRVFTCVAINPPGRPLRSSRTVKEFITGMRDAIRGHRDLFLDRRILHRDVSEHNIILTDTDEDGYAGTLIDLDLAVAVDSDGKNEQSGAGTMTGTLEFMALEILKGGLDQNTIGIEHTYRHDLESFFYVLVIFCTTNGWKKGEGPRVHPLYTWYTGNIEEIYISKRGAVEAGGFEDFVLVKFSPVFNVLKGLARELREILFSKGALVTGTNKDARSMYDATIEAYNKALRSIDYGPHPQPDTTTASPPPTKRKREDQDDGLHKRGKASCTDSETTQAHHTP